MRSLYDLHRPRRKKWRLVIATTVLIASVLTPYCLMVKERYRWEGMWAVVPTTLIAPLYPDHIDKARSGSWFQQHVAELLSVRKDETWEWQRDLMGTPEIPLASTPIEEAVLFPKAWIQGVPIPIELQRLWVSNGYAYEQLTLTGSGVRLSNFSEGQPFADIYGPVMVSYGGLPPYKAEIPARSGASARFRFELDYQLSEGFAPYQYDEQRKTVIDLEIPLVDSIEEALTGGVLSPVQDPEIDRYLLGLSYAYASFDRRHPHRHGIGYAAHSLHTRGVRAHPFDTNLVIEIEFVEADRVIHTQIVRTRSDLDDWPMKPDDLYQKILGHDRASCEQALDAITLRLVPRPDLALYELNHDTYWLPADGSEYLEMTLRQSHENGRGERDWLDLFGPQADRLRGNSP